MPDKAGFLTTNATPQIDVAQGGEGVLVSLSGDWLLADLSQAWQHIELNLQKFIEAGSLVVVDARQVERADVNGAIVILSMVDALKQKNLLQKFHAQSVLADLIDALNANKGHVENLEQTKLSWSSDLLAKLRKITVSAGQDLAGIVQLVGLLALWAASFGRFGGLRLRSLITHMNKMGFNAIPIVAISSFVVSAVIAQQAAYQLKYFGAETLAIDLSAYLIFRELAVLVAAIMVAGRSASAIAAEIGTMRMREEVDAMQVIGIDPYAALVIPRIVALSVVLPLLSVIGAIAGIAGASILIALYSGLPIDLYFERMREIIVWQTVVSGIIKAPFMAFAIGAIACLEGMKVRGSAASLGQRTTSAVVKSILAVFLIDGFFSLFFAALEFG